MSCGSHKKSVDEHRRQRDIIRHSLRERVWRRQESDDAACSLSTLVADGILGNGELND